MEDPVRRTQSDLNLASRKVEEAAWRRFEATGWLQSLVGPLGISNQPSEGDFISCLRSGLVLCNAINKIQPGSVPKVVENHLPSQSVIWDSQPLPAYQYFENVRNFLVAVEGMKLPAFDASVFERDNLEGGSSAKVVDCILELKAYHERKQMSGVNGFHKPPRSPLFTRPVDSRIHSQATPLEPRRQLDMSSAGCTKQAPVKGETPKFEDSIVKALADCMIEAKENIDDKLLASFHNGNLDTVKLFGRILSSCLEEQIQNKLPELKSIQKDHLREGNQLAQSTPTSAGNSSITGNRKCCRACLRKSHCNHRQIFQVQEKELSNLKGLLSRTKKEFEDLQSQLQKDLIQIGNQVQEMSTAALGYHKVVKENMKLYNMVQDLKGNIRVYCRVRPVFGSDSRNGIDFVGEDGSLVVLDPLKPQKEGRRLFQFDHVFGPTATQDEVFRHTQPLIRSVMDGYNVCIFAYGQTGSGKTYTMCGPSGGSTRELGINYLALNDLFGLSNRRKDIIKYGIRVQMVEIYNEQVRDLLAEDSSATKLEIRTCTSAGGLSLPGATTHSVKSTTDVLNLMKHGEVNRVVSSTSINDGSSRSHSILTVLVDGKDVSGSVLSSCLHLVDLAGSERVDKSEVTGDGLKEAQYINKSLSCLGDVIMALAQKSSHIPYRNSKLTLLLQNALGGHAKTLMIAHVSPEGDALGETITTLKFAQRVSTVELGAARSNKESSEVVDLKQQVESLKRALANREGQTAITNQPREARSPFERAKAMTERTPPRSRRLSIENCSNVKMEKALNSEDKKGSNKTPSVQYRSRRLSLEGPKYPNIRPVPFEAAVCLQNPVQPQRDPRSPTSSAHHNRTTAPRSPTSSVHQNRMMAPQSPTSSAYQSGMMAARSPASSARHNRMIAPRSPTSSTHQKRMTALQSSSSSAHQNQKMKADRRTKILPIQLPKTPEPPVHTRNEGIQTGVPFSLDSLTPVVMSHTNGKGSQIRKSIRTIGKLINGSEKRNHPKSTEVSSPFNVTSSMYDDKSPVPTSARALRRQSLTNIQTSDRSRRSSLGGISTDSCALDTRNAKTPPPARVRDSSGLVMNRWQ